MLDNLCRQALEVFILRDEIRLAVDFRKCSRLSVRGNVCRDSALGRNTAGFLLRLGDSLLTKIIDCLLLVAVRFGKRFLAVHHACTGNLTELLDHSACNLCHICPPVFSLLHLCKTTRIGIRFTMFMRLSVKPHRSP